MMKKDIEAKARLSIEYKDPKSCIIKILKQLINK